MSSKMKLFSIQITAYSVSQMHLFSNYKLNCQPLVTELFWSLPRVWNGLLEDITSAPSR